MFSDYLQDVIRCHICETPVPSLQCDNCQINLCSVCKAVHLSDKSKQHLLLAFRLKGTIPRCIKHSKRICEFHREQCDITVCRTCLSSDKHKEHKIEDVLKTFALKTERIKKDLQELAECFLVKHKETSLHIKVQKADLCRDFQKIKNDIKKEKENLQREIDKIFQEMLSKIDDMNSKCIEDITQEEGEINRGINRMNQITTDLKMLLESNDVSLALITNRKMKNLVALFSIK